MSIAVTGVQTCALPICFWNHLRVQRNILDFLYALWLDDDRTLVDEFSTIIKDLVEYDFSIVEEQMKERLNIA